jgi:hypothetical protein
VQIYKIRHTEVEDGSSSMIALQVDSSTVRGFVLSWQGAPPQYCVRIIWDCVGFYRMHTFLNRLVESQFESVSNL